MPSTMSAAFMALLAASSLQAASAHSLEDLENDLYQREKYFQPIDQAAPGFELQSSEGQAIRLSDLRGKVVVLHFIYTHCPDVCPLHAERIAEIQAMVNRTPMKEQVEFVSVTTDPSRDTPEVMREFGKAHGLDPVNWVFLTALPGQPEDATRKLAEAYGHKFRVETDGTETHGVVTHVIDRGGRWRANFHGLDFDPTNLVLLVNALVNDVHRPEQATAPSLWQRLWSLL